MIIDLPRFIDAERPTWMELEKMLDRIAQEPDRRMELEEVQRFHLLYQKVSADLARVATFASEPELRRYLESLTARAYGEIHETRDRAHRFRPLHWFLNEFPRAFRRRSGAFTLAVVILMVGAIFGGFATMFDEEAKEAILPKQFSHLLGDPAKRVAEEESATSDRAGGRHTYFAAFLMQNNIKVSILSLGLGITFGIGTIIELFSNSVSLGLIVVDYVRAGQTMFMLGWLLPHGVIEIPSLLIAGQGGLVLGAALIGYGDRASLTDRLRAVGPDLMALTCGFAGMLVWAGIIESFLSQYHEPFIHYWQKILFGLAEFAVLIWFLYFRKIADPEEKP
ncbi:MAG TPA: stage II sporulation protein M [Chthoniobacter sp.]|nr:stage II sporulation protein M [Chthoniobacter sp.]